MLKLSDFKTAELWRALASEFLGTFFLVLVACGSGQPFCDDGEIDIVKISLCAGLTLAAMIQVSIVYSECIYGGSNSVYARKCHRRAGVYLTTSKSKRILSLYRSMVT